MNCEKPLSGKSSCTLKIRGGVNEIATARKPGRGR